MQASVVQWILRYSTVLARLAVGAVFLSNVADRLGIWGPPGAPRVAWGSWDNFLNNVRALNPYLPELLVPAMGWGVTVLEVILGVMLIIGFRTRWAALLSGLLVLIFALSTGILFGIKSPLNYSTFSAAAAGLLLAAQHEFPLSLDRLLQKRAETARPQMAA